MWLWTVVLHMCYRHLTLILTQLRVGWTRVICEFVNLHRQDHMLGQGSLHYFSKIKDCRVVMPENWVSNLNSHKKAGIICGVVTPKDNLWNDKTPLQTMKIFGRSWEKLKLCCKKGMYNVWCRFVDIIFFIIKNWLVIAKVQIEECKPLIKAQ